MDITTTLPVLALLILVIPLFNFLWLGIAGCKLPHKVAAAFGIVGMGTCLVFACMIAYTYFFGGDAAFQTVLAECKLTAIERVNNSLALVRSDNFISTCRKH